jgi:hypothetical protein
MGGVATGESTNPTTRPKVRISVTVDKEMADELRRRLPPEETLPLLIRRFLREETHRYVAAEAAEAWFAELADNDGEVTKELSDRYSELMRGLKW